MGDGSVGHGDHGVTIVGPLEPGFERVLTADALAFTAALHRRFEPTRRRLLAARTERQRRIDAGETPGFLEDDLRHSGGGVDGGCGAGRPGRPPLRDHRAGRAQDDDQRAQLGRPGVHGRLRGRHARPRGTTWSRARSTCATPCGARSALDHGGQAATALGDETGDAGDPAPRLAPRREARARRRRRRCRRACSTSACSSSTTPRASLDRGSGPYFYLPKLESHLEARLWNDVFCFAQDALGIARGIDPGHRAHRDDPGRVRDGRDPLRAARALRRAQRRPLGLHLLGHQEVPQRPDVRAARPRRGDDDRAVHAGLHRAAGATCHRRGAHAIGGMAAFIPNRRDPEVTAAALAKVRARTSAARPATAATAPGWRTPTWCRWPARSSTRCSATGRTSSIGNRADVARRRAADLLDRRPSPGAPSPRPASASTSTSACATSSRGSAAPAPPRIHNLMEDAATAEISAAQLWQWVHHGVTHRRGRPDRRRPRARRRPGDGRAATRRDGRRPIRSRRFAEARRLFEQVALDRRLRRVPDPARLRDPRRPGALT